MHKKMFNKNSGVRSQESELLWNMPLTIYLFLLIDALFDRLSNLETL